MPDGADKARTEPRSIAAGTADPGARAVVSELEGSTLLKTRHSHRDRFTMRMLALGDATAIIVAVALAGTFGAHRADPGELMLWALPTLPVWILLFKLYKLYDRYARRISHTAVDDLPWMAHCLLVGSLLLWGYSKLLPVIQINLREGVIFITSALVLVLVGRAFMGRFVRGTLGAETVLLAGSSVQIDKLAAKLDRHPEIGLRPVGILDGVNPRPPEREAPDRGLPSYGTAASTRSPPMSTPAAPDHRPQRVRRRSGDRDDRHLPAALDPGLDPPRRGRGRWAPRSRSTPSRGDPARRQPAAAQPHLASDQARLRPRDRRPDPAARRAADAGDRDRDRARLRPPGPVPAAPRRSAGRPFRIYKFDDNADRRAAPHGDERAMPSTPANVKGGPRPPRSGAGCG